MYLQLGETFVSFVCAFGAGFGRGVTVGLGRGDGFGTLFGFGSVTCPKMTASRECLRNALPAQHSHQKELDSTENAVVQVHCPFFIVFD